MAKNQVKPIGFLPSSWRKSAQWKETFSRLSRRSIRVYILSSSSGAELLYYQLPLSVNSIIWAEIKQCTLLKIPRHVSEEGNEMIDDLARQSARFFLLEP